MTTTATASGLLQRAGAQPLEPATDASLVGLLLKRLGDSPKRRALASSGPTTAALREWTWGEVIAAAGNRTLADRDPTAHAEVLAIRAACAALGSERLVGCDLYVTLEPCAMCAGAISFARLRRVYYAAPDPKGGALDHGPRFFMQPTCHHAPEVYGGLRESEAAELLRGFFRGKR